MRPETAAQNSALSDANHEGMAHSEKARFWPHVIDHQIYNFRHTKMVPKVVGRDRLREDDFFGQTLRSLEPFAEAVCLHKSASFLVAILGI